MANVSFNLTDCVSNPLVGSSITITPYSSPVVSGNSLGVAESKGYTDASGSYTFMNVLSGSYQVEILSNNRVSTVYVNVPSGSATLQATSLMYQP